MERLEKSLERTKTKGGRRRGGEYAENNQKN